MHGSQNIVCIIAVLTLTAVNCSPTHVEQPAARRSSLKGSWQQANPLTDCRVYHTATVLQSGKVLVVGGYCRDYLSTAEVYDPATATWSPTGSMIAPRQGHTATLLTSGMVLVVGGENSGGYTATAELYNPVAGTWSSAGATALARGYNTATLLPSGRVLVAGGLTLGGAQTAVDVYDPVTGSWSSAASMANPRRDHTATLLPSGKILVAGGWGGAASATAEVYDPATGTWSPTGSLARSRFRHTAVLLPSGKVIVAGGENETGALSSAEVYDPSAGTWSATGSMSTPRQSYTATLVSGKVIAVGGLNASDLPVPQAAATVAAVEVYDPVTGSWTATDSMLDPRGYHSTLLLQATNTLLVVGGWVSSPRATAELHDLCSLLVNTGADNQNCGACGVSCGVGQICSLGSCQAPCNILFTVNGGSTGAPAIGSDGTIYSVGVDGQVRAFNPNTGAVVWTSNVGTGSGHSGYYAIGGIAIGADRMYVSGADGYIHAYDFMGNHLWNTNVGTSLEYATPAIGSAALGGAAVVAGGSVVMAVNTDGSIRWKYTMGGSIASSSPAIATDGTTYITTWSDGNLYAINPNGTLRWTRSNGGGSVTSPAIAADGTIYTGNHTPADGAFRAFNPDGSERWRVPVGNFHGGAALAGDGTIYVGNDTHLVALKADGSIKWQASSGPGQQPWVSAGELVGDDGNIYVPVAGNQTLVVMEPTQGKIICSLPLGGYPSPPTLGSNGVMYIGTSAGTLIGYAGTSHGIDAASPWPKHHGNVANTGLQK